MPVVCNAVQGEPGGVKFLLLVAKEHFNPGRKNKLFKLIKLILKISIGNLFYLIKFYFKGTLAYFSEDGTFKEFHGYGNEGNGFE